MWKYLESRELRKPTICSSGWAWRTSYLAQLQYGPGKQHKFHISLNHTRKAKQILKGRAIAL